MQSRTLKTILKAAVLGAAALLLTAGASFAQSVDLTAGPTSVTLPDGQVVPMWGYTCTAVVAPATCVASNPNAGTGWSPVVITVPPGPLTINLTNNLPGLVPETSLMIVGQLGGGLGGAPTRTASPDHTNSQPVTWPIAGTPPLTPPVGVGIPPTQADRVLSFGTPVGPGATVPLTWGVGTGAAPLKPGTYLIESGTHPSIQGPMGLYGVLVVTNAPGATPGTAYPGVTYNADVPLVLSEIDAVQNAAVAAAVTTPGFTETAVWSGQPNQCGNPSSANYHTCYPPAVNYDPRYYLINGVAFNKTNPTFSSFATNPAPATGSVLVRFVNAGLRMHVPSIVGAQVGATGVPGFALIAEDGNVLPGTPRVQSEVFLAAGKTYDVLINAPVAVAPATVPPVLPVFDRQLSLSANNQRDGGMLAYIGVNSASAPPAAAVTAQAVADSYFLVAGNTLTVSEPGKGVVANDVGVYGVQLLSGTACNATSSNTPCVALNPDGTFVYVPGSATSGSFTYCANGTVTGGVCSSPSSLVATVTLAACDTGSGCLGGPPVANGDGYTSSIASRLQIAPPGVLRNDTDPQGHPLTASAPTNIQGGTVTLNADGSFTAAPTTPPTGTATATVTFQYNAVNSQNTPSAAPATVTVTFNGGSGLVVHVYDAPSTLPGHTPVAITDYRWIIEEDRTFQIDPACQVNSTTRPTGCPALPVPSLGTNFHTSYMPVVAAGCVGPAGAVACEAGQSLLGVNAVCDIGNGVCRTDSTEQAHVDPSQVHLDPTKHYYITIFPGDAGNDFTNGGGAPQPVNPSNPNGPQRKFDIAKDCPSGPGGADFAPGTGACGHGMGGAPISPAQIVAHGPVNVTLEETPFPTASIAVFVFEDDSPLNGENDVHGGTDTMGTAKEPGLGGFEITLFDDAGGTGDATGQMTYDMFNMPLSNSLAGTIDQLSGFDACPISKNPDGLIGMIVTCPYFESDGVTVSPLVGQAVIANMMPGRYGVVATPGADRIARGEEWLQTNTLDGQKAHDAFIKIGGPAYFQEFGPAGYHDIIGFANPKTINDRKPDVCAGFPAGSCNNSVTGTVTTARMSRTPDQRLYTSGSRDALGFTQCYVSLGDPDDDDFAFTKCNPDGTFTLSGLPPGNWRITIFDQWNDQIVDGLSTPVALGSGKTTPLGDIPVQQWHTNIYTQSYFDQNGNGIRDTNEPGLTLLPTNIRFRDGSYSNFNNTDLGGNAGFNEIFPLFNWYVVEADTTRYKQTGVHVVYDAGGPADSTPGNGNNTNENNFANTAETIPVPSNLRVPGAYYCADADCSAQATATGISAGGPGGSTGRIDPPWVTTEAWQGYIGQNEFVEFGKAPFGRGENGGIKGEVIYASTRPFDDPALLIHTSWTPDVPGVTINLYQESTTFDGTTSLKLVDTTKTSSWDDWAQGFRSDGVPNMNCPGQDPTSLFYFTLQNSTQWLDPSKRALPNNSQFKCYDGFAMFNQIQPAPFDGAYKFPSVTGTSPTTGRPLPGAAGTNCTICTPGPDGLPMLPVGKYVVEMITPPGYELVKEEDKNILIGDNYIAPVAQQFGGLSQIFIMPDQAEVNSQYNANNAQNPTQNLGSQPRHEGDTGSVETFWPCVGALRIVPDYISLFPQSAEVSPFAGASRHLCDRKEVTLEDQSSALAKFWVFTSAHVAAHYSGIILDDFSSEFDPFSPQYGEKFAVANVPVSFKDHYGVEIARTYSDQWGLFNGLQYSTWEVNPPNPTGYAPTMMVTCMNDPGPIPDPVHAGQTITDPLYNPAYSQFCYEIPFMPGQTQYMDTPVVPTAAFAEGYNLADCSYPDATPAIATVLGDPITGGGAGPWVSAAGHRLTITALGDQVVYNNAYSGPSATTAPYNQKFITRHYGFGNPPTPNCNFGSSSPAACPSVTVGGIPLHGVTWNNTTITGSVQGNVPACTIQQRGSGNGGALCGELLITAANGKKSIDTVTVTVGGKAPKYINGENAANNAIQSVLDATTTQPGDLIIVGPGIYNEMLVMWKPVRLQGVGAASVTVNANTHPSGKMDSWRREVECLFGLSLNGGFISATNPFDPNQTFTCSSTMRRKVDPIPLEPVVGWDPTLNGNIAELLQEPTLLGAYEGAGITVLAKGVRDVNGQPDPNCTANGICTPLTNSTADCTAYPSNFLCNPSRIDGITFKNSSQGGGGIFLHGWNHFTEVSNNRVLANSGTLTGGITIGQAENPDPTVVGTIAQAFGFNTNVNVHNNSVTQNAAYGDELNSTTPMGAGGVTICTGSDNYKFNNNWVCGNLSSGDGGGFAHFGLIYNGTISNNSFLFNQSTNPTIPTNGGGVLIMGAPPDGPVCENLIVDQDCPPTLTDGAGPGLVIDSNLIMGNTAESGSGGGLRLQNINGTEVGLNPLTPSNWYQVTVTNNIIADNVAGWDGGGVSMQDALRVSFINNTVVANDSTASSGVLFNTLGAANTNNPPPGCTPQPDPNQPQNPSCVNPVLTSSNLPAGLVSMQNTSNLVSSLAGVTVTCPAGNFAPGTSPTNGTCRQFSYPVLENNVLWQNRPFHIQVGGLGTGPLSQQNLVTLLPTLSQASTGQCVSGASYWEIGVRGDSAPNNHAQIKLNPTFSILTDAGDYTGANNLGSSPALVSEYCNGSRVPPENGGLGYAVPPGISDATLPNPVFNLTPAATVDEGNNWVNMTYGPLSLVNPTGTTTLGNYSIAAGSSAINVASASGAPNHDFFGTQRPQGGAFDIGAVEFNGTVTPAPTLTSIAPPSGAQGTAVPVTLTGTNLTGATAVNVSGTLVTASNIVVVSGTSVTATFTIASTAALGARTVSVTTPGGTSNTVTFTVTAPTPAPTLTSIVPASGARGTLVLPVTLTGTNLTGATAVNVPGGGVTVSGLTVVNATTIRANFSISGTAALGARAVSVTTPGGTSNTVTFTVVTASAGTLSFTSATNGVLGTVLGIRTLTFTIPAPRAPVTSVITVTNTGAAPLQITEEALTINIGGLYSVTGNTCSFTAPLAPLATCTVSVRYATPATQPPLPDLGTLGVFNLGTTPNGALALVAR